MNAIQDITSSYSFTLKNFSGKNTAFSGKMKSFGDSATSSVFADDIVSRVKASSPDEKPKKQNSASAGAPNSTPKETSGNQKDTEALKSALQNTINYISNNYGQNAATAVMGEVYKQVGDDGVTEENLGQGFLNAVKIIDRNFGISEGDKLISELNQGLNNELNAFFDNGKNEQFFDAAQSPKRMMQGVHQALSKAFEGMFKADEDDGGYDFDFSLASVPTMEDLRRKAEENAAKKILASGELPEAYAQQYIAPVQAGKIVDIAV